MKVYDYTVFIVRYTKENNMNPVKLYDKITLPKGRSIGMGKLKYPVIATIIGFDKDSNGNTIYSVMWIDAKTGKTRYTTASANGL